MVKLIDVYPGDYPQPYARGRGTAPDALPVNYVRMGGYQQLVRGEPFRGKFRDSFEKPEAFDAEQAGDARLRRCPTSTTRSAAATASWCRCRARGSRWWIATRRPSSTSRRRRPATSSKATQRVYRGGAQGWTITVHVEAGACRARVDEPGGGDVLKRQRTGAVICASCGQLVGVNDAQCYNCGRRNPGLWGFAPALRGLGGDLGFVPLVIGACIVLYLLTLVASRGNIGMDGLLCDVRAELAGAVPVRRERRGAGVRVWTLVDGAERGMAARRHRCTSSST